MVVLPKGTAPALPGLWVLESENKQMLRDAKPDSKRAKVMRPCANAYASALDWPHKACLTGMLSVSRAQVAREMLQFLAECVWGEKTLPFSIMVRHMAEFTDELTKVEGARLCRV